jgi:gluconokinase
VEIVVMGPSGAGKTTVGEALAVDLGGRFVDADDLHPAENVHKMAAGIPLDDTDRGPWLAVVGRALASAEGTIVVACSALARRYRDAILREAPGAVFVELTVPRAELERRMRERTHFMPVTLVGSQLQALEHLAPDEPGFAVGTGRDAVTLAAHIARELRARQSR